MQKILISLLLFGSGAIFLAPWLGWRIHIIGGLLTLMVLGITKIEPLWRKKQ